MITIYKHSQVKRRVYTVRNIFLAGKIAHYPITKYLGCDLVVLTVTRQKDHWWPKLVWQLPKGIVLIGQC